MSNDLVKSTKLSLKFANNAKLEALDSFISEYRKAVSGYVDFIWNNQIKFNNNVWDRNLDLLGCPQFISTINIDSGTILSARALKSASTQACAMVKAVVGKRRRLLWLRDKLRSEGKRTRHINKLLDKCKLVKPDTSKCQPELNSLCCKIGTSTSSFDCFLVLSSIGKSFGKIQIPLNHTRHSRKLEALGSVMSGIQLTDHTISLRYRMPLIDKKKTGIIVGADQGIRTCITLSDTQRTHQDIHGHDLSSILDKVSRKRRGSKSFHRALAHRNNYIRWSIKQLNLHDIKEIRLEKISNFRQGRNVGTRLNYFGETVIREALIDFAKQNGVHVVEQSSAYRSRRCSKCGFVCSKNRIGKLFSCKQCSFAADADYNASCNHEQSLPSSAFLLHHPVKHESFWWKPNGFYALDGSEITVSDTYKK